MRVEYSHEAAKELLESLGFIEVGPDAVNAVLSKITSFLRIRDKKVHDRAIGSAADFVRSISSDQSNGDSIAESILELRRDDCEECRGEEGGVLGNENIIGSRTLCDYCHAKLM